MDYKQLVSKFKHYISADADRNLLVHYALSNTKESITEDKETITDSIAMKAKEKCGITLQRAMKRLGIYNTSMEIKDNVNIIVCFMTNDGDIIDIELTAKEDKNHNLDQAYMIAFFSWLERRRMKLQLAKVIKDNAIRMFTPEELEQFGVDKVNNEIITPNERGENVAYSHVDELPFIAVEEENKVVE